MRRFAILALAAVCVFGMTSAASAHIGGLVFPIYEVPTGDLPDLRDGTLEDWEDVLPGTSLDHNSFEPLNVADGAGPSVSPSRCANQTGRLRSTDCHDPA